MAKKTVAAKKRNVKVDANGQLHVHSSFNNIIVSLANSEGQIISWSSAGKMGFRGSKKNTPYAAQMAAQDCAKVAFDLGLRKVKAYVKGPGNGRESAIADALSELHFLFNSNEVFATDFLQILVKRSALSVSDTFCNFKLSHSYNTDLGCKGTTNYFVTIISSQLFHLIYILSYITKRMPVCIVPTPPFSLLLANITIFLPNYPYFLFLSQINGIHCTFS